jgi:hypothetical protein
VRYIAIAALLFILASCAASQQQALQLVQVHCTAHDGLPDQRCTPGAIFTKATTAQICTPGYSQSVRSVPQSVKDKVYAEYGIASHKSGEYEIDHLISLELGGSNDIANLWPEAYAGTYNAHMKDQIENYLHSQVCNGKMSLKDAQTDIARNWKTIVIH